MFYIHTITDVNGLRNNLQIEILQDQTHLMLQEYCGTKAPLPSGKLRFGKILLTMPIISQVIFFSYFEIVAQTVNNFHQKICKTNVKKYLVLLPILKNLLENIKQF